MSNIFNISEAGQPPYTIHSWQTAETNPAHTAVRGDWGLALELLLNQFSSSEYPIIPNTPEVLAAPKITDCTGEIVFDSADNDNQQLIKQALEELGL